MDKPSSDVAFTPAVKAVQSARGSRQAYQRLELRGGFEREITEGLTGFIAGLESFFLATANAQGQPYVQHRGGPPGFLNVVDAKTLAFADFAGNRQYVTTGNLAENDRAFLFLMDYQNRQRIKIWGRAKVSGDPALMAKLMPEGYAARFEQAIVIKIQAWDANCPQHIPHLVPFERIAGLERENAALRAALKKAGLREPA